jgi:hypothetical protein
MGEGLCQFFEVDSEPGVKGVQEPASQRYCYSIQFDCWGLQIDCDRSYCQCHSIQFECDGSHC